MLIILITMYGRASGAAGAPACERPPWGHTANIISYNHHYPYCIMYYVLFKLCDPYRPRENMVGVNTACISLYN